MAIDLLSRKQTHFLLWRPGQTNPAPSLCIGIGSEVSGKVEPLVEIPLQADPVFSDLWLVAAADCGLIDGQVYHYWFKLQRTRPDANAAFIYCTDPTAYTVDRRFLAPAAEAGAAATHDPASVILYRQGQLIPCDPGGQVVDWSNDAALDYLPPNHRLVIYELPTRWTKATASAGITVGTGTFQDVMALLQVKAAAPNFSETEELQSNHAHLLELGVNALELLPPADSGDRTMVDRIDPDQTDQDPLKWGYGTDNFFAADYDLGLPSTQTAPTASTDLANLIKLCHQKGIRFFLDVVMAFSRYNAYADINFLDFYIDDKPVGHPNRDPEQGNRDKFGGNLFKYNYWTQGYHPITGQRQDLVPAREYMKAYLAHWTQYYRVDGLRLDSLNNIGNYDFIQEYKDLARQLWQERQGRDDRFLVVGEELDVPLALIHQNRVDGLWNEKFKQILRQVILGRNAAGNLGRNTSGEPSFEQSVRNLIDCRLLGFHDGTQAVNYITSHDVGELPNVRLYNYLVDNGVHDTEPRIKLAFVCLMTAVGIPMILAGDEFADQHDLDTRDTHSHLKQIDPVDYERMNDPWRRRIFDYVARLVKFRIRSDALAVNDTVFIHADFNEGKRVLAWKRGYGETIVVVVANFSDYGTPNPGDTDAEYVIPNFPTTPAGRKWREITQNREVPEEWIGREPIYPWEAKVYELV
ncbi:MAG: alpha-amylase family glycosyl hydrolase [Leptolyngbya sp. IPPAS B-1204]|nr:MAG: alpha amylase [Leptolyngbya sp. IPPAS B-1204]